MLQSNFYTSKEDGEFFSLLLNKVGVKATKIEQEPNIIKFIVEGYTMKIHVLLSDFLETMYRHQTNELTNT
ncbi:MAG: hypothetical protein JSU03_05025 [Bacteroidetes bacterium]|nr:hypothetical protein [Bacteroidota bacterium]